MAFLQLLLLSTVMFISTFLLGSLPLTLSTSLSPIRFHQLSIFAVGLLIGAALSIVIPEGIDTIYSSHPNQNSNLDQTSSSSSPANHPNLPQDTIADHHSTIGIALMAGFILMFLIDQISTVSAPKTHQNLSSVLQNPSSKNPNSPRTDPLLSQPWHDDTLEPGPSDPSDPTGDLENARLMAPDPPSVPPTSRRSDDIKPSNLRSHSFSTIIGLLTHSVADGIALGASSIHTAHLPSRNSSVVSLDLIIFLAIMVHKAPAAFGLVAVLMSEGLSKALVRKILLAFSLAAPMGSLITWAALALIHRIRFGSRLPFNQNPSGGVDETQDQVMQWWIGVTLLFSGGTFLFVATHALQNTSSHPVDPCCPKLPVLPQPSPSISISSATIPSEVHPTVDEAYHRPHPTDGSARGKNRLGPQADQVTVGPLLTSTLMATGMLFPWLLTRVVGGHHHHD